jgi:hypothetical protein
MAMAALLGSAGCDYLSPGSGGSDHQRGHHRDRGHHRTHRHLAARHRLGAPPTTATGPANGGVVSGSAVSGKVSAKIKHVVWIFMENHGYGDIIGSSQAPYINGLATTYGLATNYLALSHPSLPNYIAATSGATQGITDDNGPSSHPLNVGSIFSQLPTGQSRSLEQGMPANCSQSDSDGYAIRHNPEAYYTNLGPACSSYDVPFGGTPDLGAAFTFVTPNLTDDMHDGTISEGDDFLKSYVPALLATSQYQSGSTVIFIAWDEDSGPCSGCTNRVPLIVISPYTSHVQDGTSYSHYSLLRTTEELLGVPLLGNAVSANSMAGRFGF